MDYFRQAALVRAIADEQLANNVFMIEWLVKAQQQLSLQQRLIDQQQQQISTQQQEIEKLKEERDKVISTLEYTCFSNYSPLFKGG